LSRRAASRYQAEKEDAGKRYARAREPEQDGDMLGVHEHFGGGPSAPVLVPAGAGARDVVIHGANSVSKAIGPLSTIFLVSMVWNG